jgi:hypothetical protein
VQTFKDGATGTWMVLRTCSERGPMVLTGHCSVCTVGYRARSKGNGRKRWITEDGSESEWVRIKVGYASCCSSCSCGQTQTSQTSAGGIWSIDQLRHDCRPLEYLSPSAPARHNTTVLLPSRRSTSQARHPTPHRHARTSPLAIASCPPPTQHVDAPPPVRSASADSQAKSDCRIASSPHPATTSTDSTVHIRPAARAEICDRPPRGTQEQQGQGQ